MKLDPSSVRTLEKILAEEIGACDEYLKLVNAEQDSLIKFNHSDVAMLSEKRAAMSEKMAILRDKRVELVSMLAGNKQATLTQLIEMRCNAAEKKKFLAQIEVLRSKVDLVEKRSREFAQVVDFSLGMVNGSISILWSATQNVTRCYNAFGGMTKNFQPAPPRDGSSLGKA